MPQDGESPKQKQNVLVQLAHYSQLAFVFPAATVVGWLIGAALDRWLHTTWLYPGGADRWDYCRIRGTDPHRDVVETPKSKIRGRRRCKNQSPIRGQPLQLRRKLCSRVPSSVYGAPCLS